MLSPPASRACAGLLLLGLMALSVGCSTNTKARGTVKGKVTFSGTPLPSGTVAFYGANNTLGSASIEKDGTYAIPDAPLGQVRISVTVPKPPPPGMMGPGMAASKSIKSVDPESGKSISLVPSEQTKIVPIPEKYASPDSSGLTFTVEKGEQTHDIKLTP